MDMLDSIRNVKTLPWKNEKKSDITFVYIAEPNHVQVICDDNK